MDLKTFEELLLEIDSELAKQMLKDLKDPERRGPQLYNAISKMLDRHKFNISKVAPDEETLGELAEGLPEGLPELTDEDLYSATLN